MARNAHPERIIQNSILQWLKWQKDIVVMEIDTQGIFNRRTKTFLAKQQNAGACFFRGVSDILVVHKTLGFIAIEVKSAVGRLSDVQLDFKSAVLGVGGRFLLARSVDDVERFFQVEMSKKIIDKPAPIS